MVLVEGVTAETRLAAAAPITPRIVVVVRGGAAEGPGLVPPRARLEAAAVVPLLAPVPVLLGVWLLLLLLGKRWCCDWSGISAEELTSDEVTG